MEKRMKELHCGLKWQTPLSELLYHKRVLVVETMTTIVEAGNCGPLRETLCSENKEF